MIPFVIDVDGVLTNGKVSYPSMERQFDVRDGHGFQLLRERTNILPIVMSGEADESIRERCKKLGVDCYLGVENKLTVLNWLHSVEELDLSNGYIAMSDDVPDMQLLYSATICFCPADADYKIKSLVTAHSGGEVIPATGGDKAFREAVNMILVDRLIQSRFKDVQLIK